jgi:riboflavin kinase/FMN adenylyltransferase
MAIGMFDGVHRGHQAVLARLVAEGRRAAARTVVATFDCHPASVVAPDRAPPLLQTLGQRWRAIAATGVDAAWLIHFDHEFSGQTAAEFVQGLARGFGRLLAVYVGEQFHFGRDRSGNVAALRHWGARLGFVTHALPPYMIEGQIVSSTRLRECIRAGDLATACRLLGRTYGLAGTVVRGDQLGHRLGFPTANLEVSGLALPPAGVYVASARLPGRSLPAVVNLGCRPTLGGKADHLQVEAHLLGFRGDLYGQELELQFLARLRDELRFPDLAALRRQIEADCEAAREQYPGLLAASRVDL